MDSICGSLHLKDCLCQLNIKDVCFERVKKQIIIIYLNVPLESINENAYGAIQVYNKE